MKCSPKRRRIRRAVVTGALLALLGGCGAEESSDAFGNFEATETTVSAQADGLLLSFDAAEGSQLAVGEAVGLVDTTQLAAQRDALLAQRRQLRGQKLSLLAQASASLAGRDAALSQGTATLAQIGEADAGANAVAAHLATAQEELARTRRLHAGQAATDQALNQQEGLVAQLSAQLQQARSRASSIRAQASTAGSQARVQSAQSDVPAAQAAAIDDQIAGIEAQLSGIADRIARAAITNPVAGTVLTTLVEPGEVVRTGSPLYTIANLTTLKLRAFASGNQLAQMRIGMPVQVLVDDGSGGVRPIRGDVTWISSDAQFTPTPIQTRDERADLVYAFDVRVPNEDGLLKVGMPGEVKFLTTPAERGGRDG